MRPQRHRCALGLGSAALIAFSSGASCGPEATGTSEVPTPRSGWIAAPPKPGHSIVGTKACSCHACEPRACCTDDGAATTSAACGDSYDFGTNGCGLEVKSCTARCYRKVWRTKKQRNCSTTAPADCCGSVDS